MKTFLRFFYQTGIQVSVLITISKICRRIPLLGKGLSLLIDNFILYIFGLEVTSASINVRSLVVGHSTGVVLGGNGIACNGSLHISSGVVFARRYQDGSTGDGPFFEIDGDLTVGANSVLLGPLKIRGPAIIGAMTLVTTDILEPGVYIGTPARKIRDL